MPRNPYKQEQQRFDDEAITFSGDVATYDYNANPGDEPVFGGFGKEGVTDWQEIVEPFLGNLNMSQWEQEYGMYLTPYSDTAETLAKNQFGIQQEVLRTEAYSEMDSIYNQAGESGFAGSGAVDEDIDRLKNMTVLSNTSQNLQLKSNITDMRKSWQSDLYSMLGTLAGMDAFNQEEVVQDDTSSDTLDPDDDPNVPGNEEGGLGLCQDEEGNWIDCPSGGRIDCENSGGTWGPPCNSPEGTPSSVCHTSPCPWD